MRVPLTVLTVLVLSAAVGVGVPLSLSGPSSRVPRIPAQATSAPDTVPTASPTVPAASRAPTGPVAPPAGITPQAAVGRAGDVPPPPAAPAGAPIAALPTAAPTVPMASAPPSPTLPAAGAPSDPSRTPLSIQILAPTNGQRVGTPFLVRGRRTGTQGPAEHLWLLVHARATREPWRVHPPELAPTSEGSWEAADVALHGPPGTPHDVIVGVVGTAGQQAFQQAGQQPGQSPSGGPPREFRPLARITVLAADSRDPN